MEVVLLDDNELVSRSLAGDNGAYQTLFERHRVSLRSMLYSRCVGLNISHAASCDDFLQEAFVKAYLNLEKFDPQYTFSQWIFAIARNLFIDYTRKVSREESFDNIFSDNYGGASVGLNPEEQIIAKQDNRRLRAALDRLTPAYRSIVELRFWYDMSYDQISKQLSLPLGTVKTQIHRARRAFICELGSP